MASAATAFPQQLEQPQTNQYTPQSSSYNARNNNNNIKMLSPEADIILPPPSATNPLPSLSAALRLDNREQLLSFLCADTNNNTTTGSSARLLPISVRRQLLVFEDDALRTLLLRQVLNDPHSSNSHNNNNNHTAATTTTNQNNKNKKNWENYHSFTYPKSLQTSIVGTKVLYKRPGRSVRSSGSSSGTSSSSNAASTSVFANVPGGGGRVEAGKHHHPNPFDDSAAAGAAPTSPEDEDEGDLLGETLPAGQHIDLVTYFLRPWSPHATQLLAQRRGLFASAASSSSNSSPAARKKPHPASHASTTTSSTRHHRLVYLPQPTALIHQVLSESGLATLMDEGVHSLQLDLFPIEVDVLSMEFPNALQESIVQGTPSPLIQTCARTLLKLQDLVGRIPRLQSLGIWGEEVLQTMNHMAVDEYLQQGNGHDGNDALSNKTMTESSTITNQNGVPSNPLALLVLDRQVDLVTPLITPLTYEGLLDEVVGIETGFLKLPLTMLNPEGSTGEDGSNSPKKQSGGGGTPNKTQLQQQQQQQVALGVHAGDSLFAEVRDQHVEKFGSFLQNQAKALQESHANFTNRQTKKDLKEIHQFVKQIPMFTQNLRSLTNHIHLAEQIKAHTEQHVFREQWQTERSIVEGESAGAVYDILEEWICSHHPIQKILRLLCLQSLCGGGLKASRYDVLRNLIVQGYGYEYLLKLHDLERLGMIRRKDTLWMAAAESSASSSFVQLRKSLILIHAEVDTVEPDDIAYVTSGYAPLSVRLVQAAVQGWTSSKIRADVLKDLPGRLVDIEAAWPPQEWVANANNNSIGNTARESLGDYAKRCADSSGQQPPLQQQPQQQHRWKPTLIVFFVGGITYSEIAALRFLSKRPSFPFRVVMITTKIINGNVMLQQTL